MKKASALADALRAIDGARTRGLDLGKVARYQLRHYRIYNVSWVITSVTKYMTNEVERVCKYLENKNKL